MGKTIDEIWNEAFGSTPEANDGKDGANTAIPSFVSDYSEEGKQKDIKEDNLAFEQMQKHTGVIAPKEVEKIEAPKTYNEIYEETSKDVLASDLARKGVSVFNFDKMMKESAKSFNMENWQKTKRIADAKASDNVSADDVDSTIKDIFAQTNKNDLVDVEDVLSSLRYKDAEGNTYYGFKGKRLYGDDLARDIVGSYVDERNHWINMGDSAYREQWSQSKYGIPYEEYAKGRAEFLEEKFKPVAEAAEVYYEEEGKIPQMSFDGEPIIDNIALELGKLRTATNAFRDNTFWSGVGAGSVEAIRTATFDFGGVLVSAEQEDALDKYLKGEELNAKERLLVEMAKYSQILAEEKSKYRKGFDAADVGEGLIGSIGFMASLGAQSALGVGKSIGKGLAEASVKEAFNRSIKEGVKLGLAKTGAWMANTSARTALSTMPYQDYAQRRLSHFQFTDNGLMKEEVNPFADMYRAYASTFAEIAAEDFGGLLDDGMKAFGVKMANAKFFNKLSGSKFADRLKDFTPAQAVIGGLKGMKLNSMVGEVAEEYVTAAIQPLITGEFFSTINEDGLMPAFNKHYADALTSEFALNTFAVCGALSAGGTLAKGVSGAMTAVEITNLRKDTKALLEGISDESLRNTLYTAINSNEADRFAPLAQMKWNSISADDASAALKVIFNDAKTHAMRGEAMETERLKVFSPYLLGAINKSYRGVDVANPTPTTEVVDAYALDEAGNEVPIGNVIYGDMDNPNAIVQVVDANGMVRNVPVAGTKFVRTSLSDYISEMYAMMFSTSISKERLNELIENVRGISNMDKEAYEKVLEENGFSVYRKGENVVLADGRFGTVRGGADSGSYIVDVTDANGNKTTELVGFESILHPTDLSMAEAQAEAQAEGSMDAPIVLPTTKDGRVSLDGINDGKVLARVLPLQMGGKQKAIEAIDAEIQRLETEQSKPTKQTGLDAMAEANERAESTASRIKVLQDARKALAEEVETPTEQTPVEETATPTAEEVESKRRERQAEMDAMSTFDFSRDYRRRNLNTEVSRNTLHKFIDNINDELKKVTDEAERKVLEHRKAQYEQTLKDMGAKKTIGEDAEFKALVEKASEALGLPIIVTDEPFANSRQNGMHRVSKDGNAIYINSRSTKTEQSVGILAHEIVHEFKQFLTPEEWAKFEDVIMTARFGKDWVNSEAYKKEIESIQDAERKSGHAQGVSDDKAREEAVAYAIQDYIFNGADGVRAFEAIVNQDLNWRDKLMEALRKVVDKLKSLFGKLDAEQSKAVQEAIAEFENVFKRYADAEKINKVGDTEKKAIAEANATDEVSHSLALADVLEAKSEAYHQKNATNVSAKTLVQANSDIQAMVGIMRPYLDQEMYGASVPPKEVYGKGLSTIFGNQSYGASMENTTICLRTLAYIEFVDDVKEKLGRPLTTEESFLASQMLYDIATDPQCLYCYVSLDRKAYDEMLIKYIQQRDAVIAMYDAIEGRKTKDAVEEVFQTFLGKRKDTKPMRDRFNMWIDAHKKGLPMITLADLRTTKSIEETLQNGDANIAKQIKDAKDYAQNSAQGKKIEDYRAYTGELLKISDKMYQRLNNAYGLRFYSFSEYTPAFIVENMQMMRDAALKGLRGLAYTKEVEFAKIFAPTQANINISIFGRRDANGNMVMDTRQGADWNEAQALREQYPNVGLVFVATNDADVEWALAQDFIDVVIPFHIIRTGSNIADFYEWTNYKDMQEDKGGKSILPNEHNNDKETFLRLAEERGLTPRFSKWVDNPNYMKLVNETRRASKDTPFLQPIFNLDEAKASFKAFVDKGGYFGGWYNVDEQGYQEGVEQVYQDIVAGKTAKDVDYGRQDVPADALNTKRKVRQHNNVVLRSSNSLQKQPNTQEVVSDADVVESYSIAMDKAEFDAVRDLAVENVGIVMPNLAEKNVKVVGYDGEERTPLNLNNERLMDWARENVVTDKSYIVDSNGVKHTCPITPTAIGKYIHNTSITKSVNRDIHLLALPILKNILSNSIEVEIHPDYNKVDNVRNPKNGYNADILMHRFYGAVEIDGDIYRAKSTVKENRDKNTTLKPYAYEVTNIELLDSTFDNTENGTPEHLGQSNNSISATKLLQNVEKSYDLGKKVLEESAIESFSISRNNEATIDKWLGKREDFTDEVKNAFKEYIADFKPATQLATTKWFANGVIRIPEDMPKVEQAMEIAQRKKVDALQYNSPMELIEQFGVVAPKEKLINPDDVPTLSNKTQVPNTDITIYDVKDSEESRKNFRELMNSHLGKESSPWCLLQADENGVLTKESARYWKHYNRYPKRAAFNNGKLVAFFASDDEPTWWDRMDKPHNEIPVVGKIKGDALGRTATMLYNERGEMVGYDNIHKGDKQNGLYEEWYNLEQLSKRGTFKNGRREGIFESWFPNGVRQTYVEFENDFTGKLAEQWNENNILVRREMRNDNGLVGARAYWNNSGEWRSLTAFMTKPNGETSQGSLNWDTKGALVNLENYTDDLSDKWNFSFLKYEWRNGKERKVYDWTKKVFYSTAIGGGVETITLSNHTNVMFADGTVYNERKNPFFDTNIVDLDSVIVENYRYNITIANSFDGKNERVLITRYNPVFPSDTFATIENGKVKLGQDATDAMVNEVMAEVKKRLDLVDMAVLEVQEDAKREKSRAEKIREMYHADNVPTLEGIEDVDKILEQISNDLASTKDSFSIDRSQYLEGIKDEEYRDWTRGKLFQIEEAVKNGLDVRLGQTISTYDKYAKKEERKAKRAKMDWDRNNAEQKVASYRAITEYGRAMMKEHFPEFIANAHADNIKSGNATLSYIEELFNKYNKSEDTAELFKVVMKTAKQIGTKARFETLRDGSRLGEQRANLIKYDVDAMNSDTISDESKATTLLHELIHAVTASGILLVEQPSLMIRTGVTPSAQLTSAVRRLKRTFDSIKKDDAFKGTYGSTSYEEMLAELANPKFAEKLKAHDIWVRVINGIREVVLAIASIVTGKDYKTSAYAELRDTLTDIIEETPMEFVGFINVVRDETIAKNYMETESVEEIASLAESEGTTSFSLVRDEAKIAELEASPKRIGYRNVILNEDGSFSSPMATHIGNTGKGKVKSATFNLGEWEEAEENPQLVDEQGKVYIYKDNGGSVKVAYDPYIHNRLDKVNAQFKEAWKRPNLVYVETEVPITDLESGYHADKAKLPVGVHSWSNGDLMLSRYDKPIRIVSWEEVADDWVARFKDRGVEFDIVPPALLPILKERGVEILPPHKGLGADATEAYEASRTEQESFSILRDEDTDTIFATAKEEFASTNDWLKTGWLMPDGTQLDFAEGGDYRGADHRAIGQAYKGVAEHQWQYLQDFESRGGIRIHMNRDGKYGTIEMTIKPTAEQKKRLRSFIGAVGGNVDVDFMDENYNTAHSASYEGVSPARVLSGITNFYDEGIKPKGNVSYSLSREDGNKVSLNDIAEGILDYDAKNGTELFDWLNFVENGEIGKNKTQFFIAIAGETLSKYGIRGNINVSRKAVNKKKHTDNEDHNLGVKEWADVVSTINNPIIISRYNNEPNAYRIYTLAQINGKNICVGVDVNATNGVEITKISTAFGRDIRKVQSSKVEEVLYDKEREKAEEQISGSDNSHLYAQQPFDSKDTTTNPKNQISEQESFSLNRDNTTVATPELEAEANEELSKGAKLAAELEEAQNTIDRMVRKLNAVTERKEMTFDEVKAFLLDSDTMSGLQEASAGQYKRIIRNVLNVLENTPNKRIKVESLVDRIQRELLSARLNLANSNLKAVAKDFKSIITKKREGRNTRGEAIAKYVDNTTRKMMEQFIKTIKYAHSFTDENNKTTTKWENILLAGRIFTNDAIDEAMATLRESLVEEYDEVKDGLLSLLEVYKTMRDCAADVQDVYTKQVGTERDIQDIKEEIDTLQGLLDIYHSGAKGFGKALREIRGMGYNTISDAEARVKALQGTLKALRGEIHSYKQEEADSINRLVEAVKDMNTAILGVDKEGRVALKEELAKKREAMGEFKKGVFRSVRSPHYGKVSSESAKQADKLPYWQRRDMVRRGNVMLSDVTETFEFGLRRMDRMSIANEWLQDGIYYQFIMHHTDGVIARSDWRYKTEKGLRNAFEEEARKRFAPNVKEGKFKFSELKERVKEKSGIVITTIESRINGEPVDKAKPTTIDLTVGQLLYIRAMVKQQGGINGYLTLGLKADQIEAIVKETEARYPEFCEFDDWIRGEEGILEQIYKIRNEIYRKIYGRDLDHTEGYFPIERMKGAIKKSEDVGETIDASTISGGIGSNKKRVRNSTPMNIDVDYFEKLDKHISESIQWCAGAELIEKMNALLSSSEFRNILEAQGFSKTAFKNGFKRAIGERLGGEEGKDTTAGKVLNSIGKNAVVSNIAFNLNSALKQLVSISATLSNEVSPKLWMYFAKNALVPSAVKKGVATLVDSFMGDDSPIDDVVSLPLFFSCYKWAKENVPTFAKRADNETMGFDIFELEGVEKWDRFANKIKEWGMKPNVLMDLFTCSILTKTYYDYQYDRNIERGMTEQEAHDDARMRASVLMNQTQQSSEGAFVSKYQSDRLTGAAAFFRAGTVAYQNSQLGFDRNARSAYQNIATMLYDMYGKQGAYDKVIEYQAEQYEKRGIAKDKAMKMAKADYRRSFLTQCNVLLHNMLLNNTLWAMSGVMTMYVAQAASFIALAFLGGSGYGDEATEISFENIHKEVAKQLRNSWWVYTIPMSQSLIGKPIADLAGVVSTFTSAKHPATLQPLFDTKSAIDKLFTVIEKEDDEEVKLQMGALGLVAFDTATRYGLGLSAKNALRIAGGLYGIAKDGETENFMNVLSSPRYLTKEFAGRPRKDETMDEYTERVSGLYKIIHSFSKGEDVSKLRKQYIDRMDEIMFYDTDFDYDKFKEEEKLAEQRGKRLAFTMSREPKDNIERPSAEEAWKQQMLITQLQRAKALKRRLSHLQNWDEDTVQLRKDYYLQRQFAIDAFNAIRIADEESLLPLVQNIFEQQFYKDYASDNVNEWGYKIYTEEEMRKLAKQEAEEVIASRDPVIKDYNNKE